MRDRGHSLVALAVGAVLTLALVAACSSGDTPPSNPPPPPGPDGALPPDGATPDTLWRYDLGSPPDAGPPDASCELGTPDNCSFCGEVCPPGADSAETQRVCLGGQCDIQCKGDHYDVNGSTGDGCEAEDDLPVHDTRNAAQDMGDAGDCDDAKTVTASLPSDDRKHLQAPVDRPTGRPDWYSMHIQDKFGCVVEADVTVSLSGLPTGASYQAEAFWVCDGSGSTLDTDSKTASGGDVISLSPDVSCTTIGDDSGTLFIKVTKASGPHSERSYTVKVKP